ncbi:jg15000 [Pararge aegeria aegeria]|uniref:Jg15000 protein n=1 Tax=Pararge aegeria aegeria TaxID=348720 RepID=A0A8S4QL08_9NEOP|nr:jg15000 [Pararge aegeria aegeria]
MQSPDADVSNAKGAVLAENGRRVSSLKEGEVFKLASLKKCTNNISKWNNGGAHKGIERPDELDTRSQLARCRRGVHVSNRISRYMANTRIRAQRTKLTLMNLSTVAAKEKLRFAIKETVLLGKRKSLLSTVRYPPVPTFAT